MAPQALNSYLHWYTSLKTSVYTGIRTHMAWYIDIIRPCGAWFYLSSFNSGRPNVMGPTPSHVFTTLLATVNLGTPSFMVWYIGSHYILRVCVGRSSIKTSPYRLDATLIAVKCVRSKLVVKHLWLPTNPHLLGLSRRSQSTF